ncbi:MAG: hypothetical protein AMK70_11410 [Nitrospira bacterium SG8_35_1]|nr:MAG: hypothetical protein AMK70_11410 [Nitrospira bacterium SG8_35_1]
MRKIQETLQAQSTTSQDILYIAFELSNQRGGWHLVMAIRSRYENLKFTDLTLQIKTILGIKK